MAKRLLELIAPRNYSVHFILNDSLDEFTSEVAIELLVKKATDKLIFHAKDLNLESIEVTQKKRKLQVAKTSFNRSNDTLTVQLAEKISANSELIVSCITKAAVTPTMHGIYPAHYEEDGQKKTIISTQFESHHAREAFVCIDEPAAKATFDMQITGPQNLTYISNMPAESTSGRTTTFKTTPIMSTYLLAFAVGDYGSLSIKTKRGVEVRAYARPSQTNHLKFAIETGARCLDFFEEYFDIKYPLPKADMVVIPEFAVSAMENWGLITYRETALLNNEAETSLLNKQRIAEVVCHELAHQWFGNLVTMKWWDDLWLNEGFATWAAALACDNLFPDWNVWAIFVADDYSYALSEDALSHSHPIRVPVENPKDISEIFDAISYRKGASSIRMLHDFLGDNTFKAGIRAYLKKFEYTNATTDDLWEALSSHSSIDVAEFMSPWTERMGYPVLSVSPTEEGFLLSQEHFLLNPTAKKLPFVWPIPLLPSQSVEAKSLTGPNMIIKSRQSVIKFNKGQSGFYRVCYDQSLQKQLANSVSGMDLVDRLGLLDDTIELAIAGNKTSIDMLELLETYHYEAESQVWNIIGSAIGSIRSTLLGEEKQQLLAPRVQKLIDSNYHQLGWSESSSETDNDRLVRPIVLALAARYELFDAQEKIQTLYNSKQPINPNLRSIIYSFIAKKGSPDDYEIMWQKYLNEDLQEQKNRWARALTQFKQPELIERSLGAITSEHVRLQDVISWLAGLMNNPYAREAAWQWYDQEWNWLEENFANGHLFSYFIMILANFNTSAKIEEIRSFFKSKNTDGINRSIEQALEKIEYKSEWIKRDQQALIEWLSR